MIISSRWESTPTNGEQYRFQKANTFAYLKVRRGMEGTQIQY